MSERPTKAYYVHEVWRNVASYVVYADNAEDAKRRVWEADSENVETIDLISTSQPRGFESVRRAPADDRKPGATDAN